MAVLTQIKTAVLLLAVKLLRKKNDRLFLSLPYENGWNVLYRRAESRNRKSI